MPDRKTGHNNQDTPNGNRKADYHKNTGNILSREQVKELNDMVQREFEVGKQERVKTLQNINFRLKTACSGQCGLNFEFDENYVVLKIRIG